MKLVLVGLFACGLALPAAAQAPQTVAITGLIQDQTGAVLPTATVELVNSTGVAVQTVAADGSGAFRFERVAPGQYELRARYAGFRPATARLRVGTRAPASQRLVLDLAALTQEITVSKRRAEKRLLRVGDLLFVVGEAGRGARQRRAADVGSGRSRTGASAGSRACSCR